MSTLTGSQSTEAITATYNTAAEAPTVATVNVQPKDKRTIAVSRDTQTKNLLKAKETRNAVAFNRSLVSSSVTEINSDSKSESLEPTFTSFCRLFLTFFKSLTLETFLFRDLVAKCL